MATIDIINSKEFQAALWDCVQKSIDACESCGASYDESYLENKWQKRLLGAWGKNCNTAAQLMAYAEKSFAF
jgi:hypothetical protein